MTVRVRNSEIYGSTAQFFGNVYVDDNIEGQSMISGHCIPYVRSGMQSGTASSHICVDGESNRSAPAGSSLTLMRSIAKTAMSQVLRAGDYIFYSNSESIGASATPTIYRYNIQTHSEQSLVAYTGVGQMSTYPQFCIYDEDTVYLVGPGSQDYYHGIYKLDFSAESSEMVTEFMDGEYTDEYEWWLSYYNTKIYAVNYSGAVKIVVMADAYKYDIATEKQIIGAYFFVYDPAEEDEEVVIQYAHALDAYDWDISGAYAEPVVVNERYVVYVMDIKHEEATDFYYVSFSVLDLDDNTSYVVLYNRGSDAFRPTTYDVGAIDDYAYIKTDDSDDGAELIFRLDVAGESVSLAYTFAADWIELLNSNSTIYANSSTNVALYESPSFTKVWDQDLPSTSGGSDGGTSFGVDDSDERVWWYDRANARLVGKAVSGGAEEYIALAGLPTHAKGVLHMLGNVFVLVLRTSYPYTIYYYLVE